MKEGTTSVRLQRLMMSSYYGENSRTLQGLEMTYEFYKNIIMGYFGSPNLTLLESIEEPGTGNG